MAELQRERGLTPHAAPELLHADKGAGSQQRYENADAEKGSM